MSSFIQHVAAFCPAIYLLYIKYVATLIFAFSTFLAIRENSANNVDIFPLMPAFIARLTNRATYNMLFDYHIIRCIQSSAVVVVNSATPSPVLVKLTGATGLQPQALRVSFQVPREVGWRQSLWHGWVTRRGPVLVCLFNHLCC